MDKSEYGGPQHLLMLPCLVQDISCFLWRTERAENRFFGDEDLMLLEVLSEVKLRDHFKLETGQEVIVSLNP